MLCPWSTSDSSDVCVAAVILSSFTLLLQPSPLLTSPVQTREALLTIGNHLNTLLTPTPNSRWQGASPASPQHSKSLILLATQFHSSLLFFIYCYYNFPDGT